MKNICIVTGSGGLIGSEAVRFFIDKGFLVLGIDNNMRAYFFGKEGSISWNLDRLWKKYDESQYKHRSFDIRNKERMFEFFEYHKDNIKCIIHAAAQPSHDWSAKEPITDFEVNANGTLNLLEATRLYSPNAVFVFCSTNKVYGDRPNYLSLTEKEKRFEYYENSFPSKGITEEFPIDNSTHSLFGVSKLSADVLCQEYGRYFQLNTGIFRGGCLTGVNHSSAELHGFLSYLVKCIVNEKPYTIFGYKGKQVRDNIHSYDVVNAFYHYYLDPGKGEVYNLGGSRYNNCSILEAIDQIEFFSGKKSIISYDENNRKGDHIWYISDMTKFKNHYPLWRYEYSLNEILEDMVRVSQNRSD